jgi:23S rRNA (pseudouridine1915-N3)-methyltransferase
MKILFRLAWHKTGKNAKQAFRNSPLSSLMFQYTERIAKFTPCEIYGCGASQFEEWGRREIGERLWLCDRGPGSRTLSSEDLAQELSKTLSGGIRNLTIAIGGPDGFSTEELRLSKPELRWCFGPLTLPHEMAAVVASEQIYRAWTILRNLPYHSGHL